MADKLLVRVYDVGLGDCILCRIPKAREHDGRLVDFHMLIDCGTWSEGALLTAALDNLADLLPDVGDGRSRLDLLVVTHEHKDHISGIDPDAFKRFKIEAIWMNAAMNPEHRQAEQTQRLHSFATRAMRGVAAQGLALDPEIQDLVELFSIDNSGAMEALRETLPRANGIAPRYVHAGQTNDDLDLSLTGAKLRVLGPEDDIDGFYLGQQAQTAFASFAAVAGEGDEVASPPEKLPENIGPADFRQLRSRMLGNAFAFAALSSKVTNNTSVVLLLEWSGKRLLFVGDAEWDTRFKKGKSNGAWNVMWNERRPLLAEPIDFLKIGHHGSENATPWADPEARQAEEPATILDAILPLPVGSTRPLATAVVSTRRSKYKTIPRGQLMVEIGRRVGSTRNYEALLGHAGVNVAELPRYAEFEKDWIGQPQPIRTDIERVLSDRRFVDVELE